MGLKDKLMEDLKGAMKSGDVTRRDCLRMTVAAIKNAEIDRGGSLEDSDILGVIAKQVRTRQESIDVFRQGNRPELQAREEAEVVVLQAYLPEQVSREEIVSTVREVISQVGAEGPRDKGKVMPRVIAELKGKADGRQINEVVTELLGQ
ncbi:MAG: GatB/YqeY domain-containing protein [Dehalococcoidia bacterium]